MRDNQALYLHKEIRSFMDSFWVSTGVVALAEMGDKTHLLALLLAARFKRPVPIIAGIFLATIVNHGLAGALGVWITTTLSPQIMRWVLGISFLAMAAWTLIPDKIEDEESSMTTRFGVFGATLVTFFLAEMGDKTQVATVAMAAHYQDAWKVVAGTTLGMMIADVPAVFLGDKLSAKLSLKWLHAAAALVFAALGVATLMGAGERIGL